jgi:hypothetical protein
VRLTTRPTPHAKSVIRGLLAERRGKERGEQAKGKREEMHADE